MKLTYAVILYEGPNNWGARSPDVPGCISTGSDIHDLRAIIREAIECHLEGMAADGDPIPGPNSPHLNRLSPPKLPSPLNS